MLTPAAKTVVFDVVAGNLDELLRTRGFEVTACRTPAETLEAVVRSVPEALVLNVGPAPVEAFEATRLVKSLPAAALLPVLHVAPAGSEAAIRSLECADAWLPESSDPEVLAAGVAALVRRFRAHAGGAGSHCELYRTIARHLPNAAVYAIDRDLKCILAEGPALQRIGRSREMLEGKSVSELARTSGLSGLLSRALSGEAFEIEAPYQGRVFLAQFVPLRDEGQEITAAMVVATDVTERKRAEEALRESEKRYRLLYEASPIGVAWSMISGEDCGRLLDANDAWLSITGYSREDLDAGRLNWMKLTPPEYLPVSQAAAAKAAQTGRSGLYEKEYIRKDGSRVPVIIGCAAVGDPRDQVIAFVIDITERKRLEAQFHEAQKMESIGVLAGGVAHDFNNLLTTILGNASLIAETLPEGSPDLARVQQIVLSAEYAADLTRQLLAYAGKARLVPAEMDVSDTVRDIARLARSFVPPGVELELDLGSRIPAVRADRNQIHQVLMNLLLNASESCGHRGAIRVRTGARVVSQAEAERAPMRASAGRYAVLEIRDSGTGIDPAMLPRIFDPFFTTKFSGRGLGLAAVQGIVRSHRGFIEVDSAPGAGSCFRVMLPAVPES